MRGLNMGGMGEKTATMALECRTATTFEGKLREEKELLEKRLDNINAVLKSLKDAPEVAKVLEALNKLGY